MKYARRILHVLIVLTVALFLVSVSMFGRQLSLGLFLATFVFGVPVALVGVLTFFPLRARLNQLCNLRKDFVLGCLSTAPVFVVLVTMRAFDGDSFASAPEWGELPYAEFAFVLLLGGCAAMLYALLEKIRPSRTS